MTLSFFRAIMNINMKFLVFLGSSQEKSIPVDIWQERDVAALEALKGGDNTHSPFISGSLCFELIGEAVSAA